MAIFKSKKKKKDADDVFLSFSEIVRNNIENYAGPYSQILKFAPDFFDLIVKLYKKDMPYPYREMISSTISYFVLPDDILPEDTLGPFGYLDDLYLCSYVIKKFKENKKLAKIVEELWIQPQNVFVISDHIIEELESAEEPDLEEAISSILVFTGVADLEEEIEIQDHQYICPYCGERYRTQKTLDNPIKNRHEKKTESELENVIDVESGMEMDIAPAPIEDDILEQIDIELQESRNISEELRKISFSKTNAGSYEKEEKLEDNEGLLQNKIPVHLILHMTKKAKYNHILTGHERNALFDIASRKMKYKKLSDKQIIYLESLLQKAISQGIVDAPCEDDPCDRCEELREIMKDVESNERVSCPYCGLKFANQSYLEQHIKIKHGSGGNPTVLSNPKSISVNHRGVELILSKSHNKINKLLIVYDKIKKHADEGKPVGVIKFGKYYDMDSSRVRTLFDILRDAGAIYKTPKGAIPTEKGDEIISEVKQLLSKND